MITSLLLLLMVIMMMVMISKVQEVIQPLIYAFTRDGLADSLRAARDISVYEKQHTMFTKVT